MQHASTIGPGVSGRLGLLFSGQRLRSHRMLGHLIGHVLAGSKFLQEDADLMWEGSNLGTLVAGAMARPTILLKLIRGAAYVAKRAHGYTKSMAVSSPAPGMLKHGPLSTYASHAGISQRCKVQLTCIACSSLEWSWMVPAASGYHCIAIGAQACFHLLLWSAAKLAHVATDFLVNTGVAKYECDEAAS